MPYLPSNPFRTGKTGGARAYEFRFIFAVIGGFIRMMESERPISKRDFRRLGVVALSDAGDAADQGVHGLQRSVCLSGSIRDGLLHHNGSNQGRQQ